MTSRFCSSLCGHDKHGLRTNPLRFACEHDTDHPGLIGRGGHRVNFRLLLITELSNIQGL